MEYTKSLAEHVAKTTYEDLAPEVIEKTKTHILDSMNELSALLA